jgi:molybdopterin/thiamine biosynthesis adenylyltransferase
VVVCGLDSVPARRYIKIKLNNEFASLTILLKRLRWMNGMLMSLLQYNEDNTPDQNTMIPMVDGGTEGLKGNARVIMPGITACVDCTLGLYPPQVN